MWHRLGRAVHVEVDVYERPAPLVNGHERNSTGRITRGVLEPVACLACSTRTTIKRHTNRLC